MFNLIVCGIALVIGGLWFYYSYRLVIKNEEYEERIKSIRARLRIGAYNEAMELTEIDYQYEVDNIIDITDDKDILFYKIILGNDELYFDLVDDENGTHFNCIVLTENGKTELLLTNEEWNKL